MEEIQKTVDPRVAALQKARAAKAAKRAAAPQAIDPQVPLEEGGFAQREPIHEPTRTPIRAGKGEAIGRGGEILSRKRTTAGDIFDIPKELIPENWTYQWAAVSVTGNTEILLDQNLMFAENGWRPVPAERYPGRFMPVGYKGNIIRGGQMLMERPKSLTDEARAEEVRTARQLISDRNESLKLGGVARSLPDGFEAPNQSQRRMLRTGGDNVRMSIDRSLDADVPRSAHTLAEPGE